MAEVCNVDVGVLRDPQNEDRDPIAYTLNGAAHLANQLEARGLAGTPLMADVMRLIEYFTLDQADRPPGQELEVSNTLMLYGTVGASLFHLGDRDSPQLRTELERFAVDPGAVIGNYYLFYIAGRLAARGWVIDFIPESREPREQRPDFSAYRDHQGVHVEANAKQPRIEVDTPERVYRVVRDLVEEKKQKFSDQTEQPAFYPGMIVGDISPAHFEVNETGTEPFLELRRDLKEDIPGGGFFYRLYEDATWRERLHNRGNVFTYAVDEFAAINRGRYAVTQFLLTAARRAVLLPGNRVAYPRYHVLLVDRHERANAVLDLSRYVYLV